MLNPQGRVGMSLKMQVCKKLNTPKEKPAQQPPSLQRRLKWYLYIENWRVNLVSLGVLCTLFTCAYMCVLSNTAVLIYLLVCIS